MGFKFTEKSITVVGIGHLVYLGRIRQRTNIPNTVDSEQRSGTFATSIRGDPPRTLDLYNHSRWFFSRVLSLRLADPAELLEHVEIRVDEMRETYFRNIMLDFTHSILASL